MSMHHPTLLRPICSERRCNSGNAKGRRRRRRRRLGFAEVSKPPEFVAAGSAERERAVAAGAISPLVTVTWEFMLVEIRAVDEKKRPPGSEFLEVPLAVGAAHLVADMNLSVRSEHAACRKKNSKIGLRHVLELRSSESCVGEVEDDPIESSHRRSIDSVQRGRPPSPAGSSGNHRPKHFRIEDVILEERNLRPVDPPGK
ncbi:hypothetical protein BHM03_00054730 [Ensete ventricosum]|nr:hypothetical protein BHM03_00054730 [Ensete ventricosum]